MFGGYVVKHYFCIRNSGCSSARLEYASGGRVVASSNLVATTKNKLPQMWKLQTVDKVALEFTSQSNFSFMKLILYKIKFLRVFLSFNSPLFSLIFASFFKFIHAYVSPTFISIRAFPYICVYRKP